MAAVKGHRYNMNRTWHATTLQREYNNMYNQIQNVANFPYIPTTQAFPIHANIYHNPNNVIFDTPTSSNSSGQGSPRPFENRNSISSQGFDGSSEDAISAVSSPSDDFNANCYFPDHLTAERGSVSLEPGPSVPHFPLSPVHQKDPRASPPQYTSPNRSRQGSTSIPAPQHIVTADHRILQKGAGDELPVSPTNRRMVAQKPRTQRRGVGQQKDFYTISAPPAFVDDVADDEVELEPAMVTTLNARAQLKICKEVDQALRDCLFWWLVTFKFDIPRNPRARDIETPDDRDYEGFCGVVNDLTAKRWVPREAVHHERIAELNTVLAGPSEIRHMLAHPERHLKSDWRMLGLIAAAIEVCKILQYKKGHRQLFRLYQTTEAQICAMKVERLKIEATMADISISKDEKGMQ
ncbi:hypothetical protein L211DRAFT_851515 [Terfezia boudieri ATCC MYA-4762]|uniref:Uncharacterized protein n=1 Tax=Terfezia boudieri ATCC MYA-4762 TaxID=1051890 RepID=A0A3N4LEL7_9PEZI|nr:hypothetical protein L211DRAFT_851515 [Terfezia boudieri ATCC MYA-4762]